MVVPGDVLSLMVVEPTTFDADVDPHADHPTHPHIVAFTNTTPANYLCDRKSARAVEFDCVSDSGSTITQSSGTSTESNSDRTWSDEEIGLLQRAINRSGARKDWVRISKYDFANRRSPGQLRNLWHKTLRGAREAHQLTRRTYLCKRRKGPLHVGHRCD